MGRLIDETEVMRDIDAIRPVDPQKSDYAHGIDVGLAMAKLAIKEQQTAQQWIPCKVRLPEEYGEYRITWVTSAAPGKRFIGDAEFEVTGVWDNEHDRFKGEWLLDEYIKNYTDVEVIAWKTLEDPWEGES